MLKINWRILIVCLVAIFSSCHTMRDIKLYERPITHTNRGDNSLTLNYWGVGCFHIKYKGLELITDPFISRPNFRQVALGKIQQDTIRIKNAFQNIEKVDFVLAGHGHYDHAMDIPFLGQLLPPSAKYIGSTSLHKQLMSFRLKQDYIMADSMLTKSIYNNDSTIRIIPFPSDHASHVMGIHLFHGETKHRTSKSPTRASAWKDGTIFSFVIDFMSNHQIEKRIFIQTSSAKSTIEKEIQETFNERQPDIFILNAYTLRHAMKHHTCLIRQIGRSMIIICHWENFFRPWEKPIKPIKKWQMAKTLKKINQTFSDSLLMIPIQGSEINWP